MKIICSGIASCNNCIDTCQTNCYVNCNKNNCCENQICSQVAGKNEFVNIKYNKCIFDKIFDCVDKYNIIGSILISTHLFIFVQTEFNTENNSLYVITADVNVQTYTTIDNTMKLQLVYNIYVLGKTYCLKTDRAKKLEIKQIVYNQFSDIFVVLFRNKSKTLIGTIDYLESIFSLGTYIDFLKTQSCNTLIINEPPQCIVILTKTQYKVMVYDECCKSSRGYIISIE